MLGGLGEEHLIGLRSAVLQNCVAAKLKHEDVIEQKYGDQNKEYGSDYSSVSFSVVSEPPENLSM